MSEPGRSTRSNVDLVPERRFDGTGVLRYLDDGLSPTLDDLAWLMIIVSDNSATAMLVEALGGPEEINRTTALLGCPTTQLNESITLERALAGESFSWSSPRDLAELYVHLGERARAMLFRQQHLLGPPRRLPHLAADVGIAMPVAPTTRPGTVSDGSSTPACSRRTPPHGSSPRCPTNRPTSPVARTTAPVAFGAIGELLCHAWGGLDDTP